MPFRRASSCTFAQIKVQKIKRTLPKTWGRNALLTDTIARAPNGMDQGDGREGGHYKGVLGCTTPKGLA